MLKFSFWTDDGTLLHKIFFQQQHHYSFYYSLTRMFYGKATAIRGLELSSANAKALKFNTEKAH